MSARSRQGSSTGWCGHGHASVEPIVDRAGIRLFERGYFMPEGSSAPIRFYNVYRFQNAGSHLSLSHERYGAHAPVRLFDLVADSHDRLISFPPHRCARDDYSAVLCIVEGGLKMTWFITGPRKNERLDYQYGFRSRAGDGQTLNDEKALSSR